MTSEEIIEGNKLIAYSKFAPQNTTLNIEHFVDSGNDFGLDHYLNKMLFFHKDWNMLMDVVQVIGTWIRDNQKDLELNFTGNMRILYTMKGMPIFKPIAVVWKHVVEFIKWHNDQLT